MFRTLTIVLISFIAGTAAWALFDHYIVTPSQDHADLDRIEHHWRIVNEYRERTTNPKYLKEDKTLGMTYFDVTIDPEPSFAALTAAGELVHLDLVLPNVPAHREIHRYWMKWGGDREDVYEMLGNSTYHDYQPAGDPPLHLNIWFHERAKPEVQQLIQDLEAMAQTIAAKEILGNTLKAPTPRVARQPSAPEVPPHDKRDRFFGDWGSEGEVEFSILQAEDQSVVIRESDNSDWVSVVNNVRWEGDELHFDLYMYYTGDINFGTEFFSINDHPYSGVRNSIVLRLGDDPQRLRVTISTKHLDQPEEYDCFRISTDQRPN